MAQLPSQPNTGENCQADFSYVLWKNKRLILTDENSRGRQPLTDCMADALAYTAHHAAISLSGYTVIYSGRMTRGWVQVELDAEGSFLGFNRFPLDQYERLEAMKLASEGRYNSA